MTPKQIARKIAALAAKQAELRDQMRALSSEVDEHFANASEAADALEVAADAVSRLM